MSPGALAMSSSAAASFSGFSFSSLPLPSSVVPVYWGTPSSYGAPSSVADPIRSSDPASSAYAHQTYGRYAHPEPTEPAHTSSYPAPYSSWSAYPSSSGYSSVAPSSSAAAGPLGGLPIIGGLMGGLPVKERRFEEPEAHHGEPTHAYPTHAHPEPTAAPYATWSSNSFYPSSSFFPSSSILPSVGPVNHRHVVARQETESNSGVTCGNGLVPAHCGAGDLLCELNLVNIGPVNSPANACCQQPASKDALNVQAANCLLVLV